MWLSCILRATCQIHIKEIESLPQTLFFLTLIYLHYIYFKQKILLDQIFLAFTIRLQKYRNLKIRVCGKDLIPLNVIHILGEKGKKFKVK